LAVHYDLFLEDVGGLEVSAQGTKTGRKVDLL